MTHTPQRFEAQVTRTVRLDYLVYLPPECERQPCPMILFLHSAGGRGDDLERVKRSGIPRSLEMGHDLPFIVVSPQCPAESHWTLHIDALNALLDEVIARYPVDASRIYATGASMGGAGTWFLAGMYPERFAAIAPIASRIVPLPLQRLKNLPVWAFHGELDEVVPVSETYRTVEGLKSVGADVKLTVYPGVGHDSEEPTYANPELYEWFLSNRRF